MINKIYELKNKLLQHVEEEVRTKGIERLDGEKVDMIKDLAEAEAYCMKAKYYDTVVAAMGQGSSGYQGQGGGTGSSAGYGGMQGGGRGYSSRDNMQSSGYGGMGHQDLMFPLRMALQAAGPEEREKLRQETSSLFGTR